MKKKFFVYILSFFCLYSSNCGLFALENKSFPFFRASKRQPYHLSIGSVLFNDEGKIAVHYFKEILGEKDIYILMRETMENDETPLDTLCRGLMEEFGAKAEPKAFLGSLSGFLKGDRLSFDKTTLYIACKLVYFDPCLRDLDDPEARSIIKWIEPEKLIKIMEKQGEKYGRIDLDESIMVKRAMQYIEESYNK